MLAAAPHLPQQLSGHRAPGRAQGAGHWVCAMVLPAVPCASARLPRALQPQPALHSSRTNWAAFTLFKSTKCCFLHQQSGWKNKLAISNVVLLMCTKAKYAITLISPLAWSIGKFQTNVTPFVFIYLDWHQPLIPTHTVMKRHERWLNNLIIWIYTICRHENAAVTLAPGFLTVNLILFIQVYDMLWSYAAKIIFFFTKKKFRSDIWFIKRNHISTQYSSWNNWSKRRLGNSLIYSRSQSIFIIGSTML